MLNFVVVRQRKILRSSDPDNSYYRYFWFVKVCESACEYLGQKRETKSQNWQIYCVCTVCNNTSDTFEGELVFPPRVNACIIDCCCGVPEIPTDLDFFVLQQQSSPTASSVLCLFVM